MTSEHALHEMTSSMTMRIDHTTGLFFNFLFFTIWVQVELCMSTDSQPRTDYDLSQLRN